MTLAAPTPDFLDALKAALGPAGWRAPEDAPEKFEEPRGRWRGQGALVLRPNSVEEVSMILSHATAARVGVVPISGGTGLVGGQVAPDGPPPLILSTERMTAIRDVDPADNVLITEAGVILADAQAAAEGVGRLFPLSLAAEGSCRIGGNLATNAGGLQVLRYGNARDLTLGVEAVLPDGQIVHGLKRLRKDNTGYDLRHLLIGAEGTLGVITAAALRLFPRPAEVATGFLSVPDPAAAVALLNLLRDEVGETISAFELIDATGVGFLAEAGFAIKPPLEQLGKWSVLVELGGQAGAEAALERALEAAFAAELVTDGALAQNESQRAAFWALRESIPEANRKVGAIASHDISVPVGKLPAFIAEAGAAFAARWPALRINCFGHVGDGNLHYNLFPPKGGDKADHAEERGAVTRLVHDLADAAGGSISAEHGIGRLKAADLSRYGDPGKLAAMKAIKAALDPAGIMNPGAIFVSS